MRTRLFQATIVLALFGSGVVVGSLKAPREATAQSGVNTSSNDRRASLGFVRLTALPNALGSFRLPPDCLDVTIVPARVQVPAGQIDGVYVLCERR